MLRGVVTIDNGKLARIRSAAVLRGVVTIVTVSYTHLTLPTNREV